MAATQKRSLKETFASTVEGRGPRFLFSWLAGAMVISLLVGLGVGMQVQKHRTTTPKPVAAVKKKPVPAVIRIAQVTGVVTVVKPTYLTVAIGRSRTRVGLIRTTQVYGLPKGKSSDLVVGRHLLVRVKPSTSTTVAGTVPTAQEVIVLPPTSALGSPIAQVGSGTLTFTFGGAPVKIKTKGTQVDAALGTTRASLRAGQHVLMRIQSRSVGKKSVVSALEIVVLSANSAFG